MMDDDDDSPKVTREGIHLIRVGFKKVIRAMAIVSLVSVKPCIYTNELILFGIQP